jgi:hypothetical protein
MRENLKVFSGAILAVAMVVAALWTWRHAARIAQSDVQLLALRSAAIALAAGAQLVAIVTILMAANVKDRLLRAIGFTAAGICAICMVSAVALGLAGR